VLGFAGPLVVCSSWLFPCELYVRNSSLKIFFPISSPKVFHFRRSPNECLRNLGSPSFSCPSEIFTYPGCGCTFFKTSPIFFSPGLRSPFLPPSVLMRCGNAFFPFRLVGKPLGIIVLEFFTFGLGPFSLFWERVLLFFWNVHSPSGRCPSLLTLVFFSHL